jgi:hypothetical protein
MPYTNTAWTNGATALNATNMNHAETQFAQALTSLNLDLFPAGVVLSGLVASKDGTTATQLNVTAGRAYLIQADSHNDSGVQAPGLSTQTTVTINTTYNLYLQPDGTWYWSTSNSPAANSLYIATVSTDGSGNIKTVTDKRTLTTGILTSGILAPVVASQSVAASVTPSQVGTPYGGVTFGGAAAISGDASAASASFNGTTGTVAGPGTGLPSGSSSVTIEAWVKIAGNPSANACVADIGPLSINGCLAIQINTSGQVSVQNGNVATGNSSALSLSVWHHLVGTWDGTKIHCFVDGSEVGTGTAATMSVASSPPVGIAAFAAGGTGFLSGSIAEGAVYGSVLSLARITAHFTAAPAGGYAAAVAADTPLRYYRLNEPAGALYANSSIASTLTTVGTDGSATLGRVASVGGQATVGIYGLPVVVAQAQEGSVSVNTLVTVASFTTPNDSRNHLIRVCSDFRVGSGNTNNGTVSLAIHYTDDSANTGSLGLTNSATIATYNAVACNKGFSFHAFPVTVLVAPNTTVQGNYTNSAAGTIADKVTFYFELLT